MLKIRLTRLGKKNNAFFRLVVAEHSAPIKGRFIEAVGFINPHTKEKKLDKKKILHWIEKGAKCSDTAHNLLVKEGIIKGPKKAIKKKKKAEEKKEESPKTDVEEKKGEKEASEKKTEEIAEEKSSEKVDDSKAETPKMEENTDESAEKKKEEDKKDEKAG